MTIQEKAQARGHTVPLYAFNPDCDLELLAREGTDYEGEFAATCSLTGDALTVKGWLFDIEEA